MPAPYKTRDDILITHVPHQFTLEVTREKVEERINGIANRIPLYKYYLIERILKYQVINSVLMFQFLDILRKFYVLICEFNLYADQRFYSKEHNHYKFDNYYEELDHIHSELDHIIITYMDSTNLHPYSNKLLYTDEVIQYTYEFLLADNPTELTRLADMLINSRESINIYTMLSDY
jgi:hypothetical protein